MATLDDDDDDDAAVDGEQRDAWLIPERAAGPGIPVDAAPLPPARSMRYRDANYRREAIYQGRACLNNSSGLQ